MFISMLQYIFIHAEASNTMDRNPSRPIPWTENHHVQKSCAKIMHRTIGGSAQPNIGSKTKIFQGAASNPIKLGYGCPSNPLLTMWKEYNTTQQVLGHISLLSLKWLAKCVLTGFSFYILNISNTFSMYSLRDNVNL